MKSFVYSAVGEYYSGELTHWKGVRSQFLVPEDSYSLNSGSTGHYSAKTFTLITWDVEKYHTIKTNYGETYFKEKRTFPQNETNWHIGKYLFFSFSLASAFFLSN